MAESPFPATTVDLTGLCENPGESHACAGHVDVTAFEVGEKRFELTGGLDFDVVFTNAGDGILLTGLARAHAVAACDRCLEPAELELAGELEEYYLFEVPEDEEAHDGDFELMAKDHVIDLAGPLHDAVVMDTPFVVLCRPDCKGLCPVCGQNLNESFCDCAEKAQEDWAASEDNPFAVLSQLKQGE